MKLLIIPILLLFGACASLTEDQIFEREYARHEAKVAFERQTKACEALNGNMVIIYRGHKSARGPSRREYENARCRV